MRGVASTETSCDSALAGLPPARLQHIGDSTMTVQEHIGANEELSFMREWMLARAAYFK